MRFEVLAGKHHSDGKTYHKGDTVVSDTDLTDVKKGFVGKFRKLDSLPEAPAEKASSDSKGKAASKDAGDEKKAPVSSEATALAARGKDVTEKFPEAEKVKLKVYVRDKLYHIYEAEETKPIKGGEGLSKDKIDGAIEEYLES